MYNIIHTPIYDEKIRYARGKKNITQGLNTKGKSRGWSKEYFKIITCPVFHVSLSARSQHMPSRPRHSPVVNKINNPMTTLIPQREAAFLEIEEQLYDYDLL